eukprot:TRINITY_DN10566_c0_g1_i1.p2 TRINITY_DN10566_c0_g1~~TRINITY_DN10566_c0_g1_i1.p2  ORF type:complete len:280 (+),score=35.66 TRINITY_DN10566_c0_g1_i1:87-842(+)
MTDRFYPLGLPADKDVWKTTYEVQNEMRSFQRSAFPPGCAVHQPGARDKFGFSTPGPIAERLAKPSVCLVEDTDIPNPRMHQAVPRYQEPDDRNIFHTLDVPEMQRSYRSPVASMSFTKGSRGDGAMLGSSMRSLNNSVSLPQLRTSVRRLQDPHAPVTKVDDDQYTYFVPKNMQRSGMERIMATNPPKLQKQNRLTMPFGDGTGFKSQTAATTWWPEGGYRHDEPTSYRNAYTRPPFYRNSPLANGAFAA